MHIAYIDMTQVKDNIHTDTFCVKQDHAYVKCKQETLYPTTLQHSAYTLFNM